MSPLDLRNIRELHGDVGLETQPVHTGYGKARADMFRVGDVFVRIVGWWGWLVAVLFGAPGAVILARGTGKSGPPRVVLDWETYARLLVGLQPETLKSLGIDAASADAAKRELESSRIETGGAF